MGAYYVVAAEEASTFDTTNFSEDTKRQLSYLSYVGLEGPEADELGSILSEMGRIYGEYQVCPKSSVQPSPDPDTEKVNISAVNLCFLMFKPRRYEMCT